MLTSSAVSNTQSPKDEEKKAPSVKKVILYKHGMGYFERIGKIKDNAIVSLDFKTEQMQDLLKSLYAIDYGKDCRITFISYDSKDPIDKQLENILIRVPEGSALTKFLTQLKGVKAEIKIGNETARGNILGIEPINQMMDKSVITSYKIVVLTEDGTIQPFNLLEVCSLKILDERIQEDLIRILDIYKNAKYTDRKVINIQTSGKGERDIQIGYLVEMPIWKTSYRLILGEKIKPYLQGWAIMENPTDEDWDNVDVSFVAGNPISFKLDLYTSYYPARQVISLASIIPLAGNLVELSNLPAPSDTDAFADSESDAEAPCEKSVAEFAAKKERAMGKADYAPARPCASPSVSKASMAQLLSQSISSIASGTQIGELFAYESKAPISVARHQSAMVPIVTENIDGSKILYYRGTISPRLMNAFYLNNSSKLTLETGPVNIFEGSTAVGEGLIRQSLQPGMKEIIPYAIEAGCTIETTGRNESKPVHKGSFINGVMILKQYDVREAKYKCINKTGKSFTTYLDHPRTGNYTLMEPSKFEEEIAGYYRFKNELGAGKTLEFKVVEQQEISTQVYLQNQSTDYIRYYINQRYFSRKVKEFMQEIVALMNNMAEQERIINQSSEESEKLIKDQERYRKNMEILNVNNPKESAKRAEYLERLTKIEEKLEKLDQTANEATEKQESIRQELDRKIQSFTEE